MILLIFLLITKHFFADFILQNPWMVFNKGNLKSLAGYAHAGVHGLGTLLALFIYSCYHYFAAPVLLIVLAEMVAHYSIDYTKVQIGKVKKYTPNDGAFWNLLGLDQYLHNLCYVAICLMVH